MPTSPRGSGCHHAIRVWREDLLQHIPLDRLLQERHAAETDIDAVGVVTGDEHKRHAALFQYFGDRIDEPVAEIDIEDGRVEVSSRAAAKAPDAVLIGPMT